MISTGFVDHNAHRSSRPVGVFIIPLTLLWIAGVTNAIYLIDDMNGLAGACLTDREQYVLKFS